MSQQDHRPLNDVETALSAWSPQPVHVDRDRLMFAAGEAVGRNESSEFRHEYTQTDDCRNSAELVPAYRSARESTRATRGKRTATLWQAATCLSSAAALFMALMLWQERGDRVTVAEVESAQVENVVQKDDAPHETLAPRPSQEMGGEAVLVRRSLPAVHYAAGTYLAQRHRLLTTPVERWPTTTGPRVPTSSESSAEPHQPTTIRSLLEEYLPREVEPDEEFYDSATWSRVEYQA